MVCSAYVTPFIKTLRHSFHLARAFPYAGIRGKWLFLEQIFLRVSPKATFPSMNIVPLVQKAYALKSDDEFTERYAKSMEGFDEIWCTSPRETKEQIEHFYTEHDRDIWRQAALSRDDYLYKKKLLWGLHVAKRACKKDDPILDYGCGAGTLTHLLMEKGFLDIHVADIPSQTLDFVKKELVPAPRRIMPVTDTLQLPQHHYACIYALDCLEHTLDPLAIAERLLAALKPGGMFMVQFPKEDDFSCSHTRRAQAERPQVFALLAEKCETIVEEFLYRKR